MQVEIELPVLHAGQAAIYRAAGRRNAVRCGRRWGKTVMLSTIAADRGAKGRKAGVFTPQHKQWSEIYDETIRILQPIIKRANKNEAVIRTITGGSIDFWGTDDNELAGRGREYDDLLMDEAAFGRANLKTEVWPKAMRPTLLTRRGRAWVFSTPKGINPDNFFYDVCHDEEWTQHYAPTSTNPFVPLDELEKERLSNHPLVFRQEYLAEFVDWSGIAFFDTQNMLENGQPVDLPPKCDAVFAVIDTAMKDGKEHDGTAVSFYAVNQLYGHPLILLDWDIISIEGSLLESWLPSVYQRLESLAKQTQARKGSLGAFIEDKTSGTILLQQAKRRNWVAHPLPEKMTAAGKAGRALSVSGYVYQGKLKISRFAFDKVSTYKGATRNHWLAQVTGFRIGAKEGAADDLLDTMCYAVAIVCGDGKGF